MEDTTEEMQYEIKKIKWSLMAQRISMIAVALVMVLMNRNVNLVRQQCTQTEADMTIDTGNIYGHIKELNQELEQNSKQIEELKEWIELLQIQNCLKDQWMKDNFRADYAQGISALHKVRVCLNKPYSVPVQLYSVPAQPYNAPDRLFSVQCQLPIFAVPESEHHGHFQQEY